MQGFCDPLIFIQNLRGQHKCKHSIVPTFENSVWGTAKKDSRDENIGIEDNFHLRPRTSATASLI